MIKDEESLDRLHLPIKKGYGGRMIEDGRGVLIMRSSQIGKNVTLTKVANAFPILMECLEEAINGLKWRIENYPLACDEVDIEKLEEWQRIYDNFSKIDVVEEKYNE